MDFFCCLLMKGSSKARDRKGMPEVLQTRFIVCRFDAAYAGGLAQPPKCYLNARYSKPHTSPVSQEGRVLAMRPAGPLLFQIAAKHLLQVMAERNVAGLVELGLADGEHSCITIEVAYVEPARLSDAHPGTVEKEQEHTESARLHEPHGVVPGIGNVDQSAHLLVGIDIRVKFIRHLRLGERQMASINIVAGDGVLIERRQGVILGEPVDGDRACAVEVLANPGRRYLRHFDVAHCLDETKEPGPVALDSHA